MARTALLALLAREVQKAGKAGRSKAGLRVVKSDGEYESVRCGVHGGKMA